MTEDNGLKLPPRLRQMLIASIDADKLSVVEIFAIFTVLKHARTEDDLDLFIRALAQKFTVLNDYIHLLDEEKQSGLIAELQPVLTKLIMDDPALAVEITRAAQDQDITLDILLNKYPVLGKYLNQ